MALSLKVVLLGDSHVGKTALRTQLVHHVFSNAYRATVGGDFLTLQVSVTHNGSVVDTTLQVWDTAGQERFDLLLRAFYRGADVAVVVFDLTRAELFQLLPRWIANFTANVHVDRPAIVVVGNKLDRVHDRRILVRQMREYAAGLDAGLVDSPELDVLECSAKSLADVSAVFYRCAEIGVARHHERPAAMEVDAVSVDVARGRARSGCC